ncbi:MAG: cytochrome b/b6 domain-containing protein [Burkholderiales bacterium]|nr:cytochrome b/b6 domain-containing protein [Burkholderiales bacterium]
MSKILVWDLPVRLFHWLLVMLVVASIISVQIGGNAMQIHMLSGYTVLALVLFRILWGFFGSTHARFASFVRSPATALAYLGALRRNQASQHLGHNPAGAWSVLAMLIVLLVQACTGLFANDDIATEGPLAKLVSKALSDRITGIHHLNSKLLFALIGLHLSAVAFYVLGKHEDLVKPMITGFKEAVAGRSDAKQHPARIWLAALLLALCAGSVYLLLKTV